MASAIDVTKPVTGNPTTESVRANFAAAKSEIEALQGQDVSHSSNIASNTSGVNTNASGISALNGRNVTAGDGLIGGGAISANITLNVGAGVGILSSADSVEIDLTFADERWLGIGNTAANSTLFNSQNEAYYRNASNMNSGTLPSDRLNGTYAGANAGQVGGKSIIVLTQSAYDALTPDADTIYFTT